MATKSGAEVEWTFGEVHFLLKTGVGASVARTDGDGHDLSHSTADR